MAEAISNFPGIHVKVRPIASLVSPIREAIITQISRLRPSSIENKRIELSVIPRPRELENAPEAEKRAYDAGWMSFWRGEPVDKRLLLGVRGINYERGRRDASEFNWISL